MKINAAKGENGEIDSWDNLLFFLSNGREVVDENQVILWYKALSFTNLYSEFIKQAVFVDLLWEQGSFSFLILMLVKYLHSTI